jgi:L-fuculose-phosphate aldolase
MMNTGASKKIVCEFGKKLLAEGFVSGTWGNISMRIDDTFMAITPSGREYETMEEEDIVIVNYKDHSYQGDIKPSSEFKLHTEIYRTRNKINAVIHTHQMNASTVAAARREVPPILDDMAQIIGPTVRCADYALPNTRENCSCYCKSLERKVCSPDGQSWSGMCGQGYERSFCGLPDIGKGLQALLLKQSF